MVSWYYYQPRIALVVVASCMVLIPYYFFALDSGTNYDVAVGEKRVEISRDDIFAGPNAGDERKDRQMPKVISNWFPADCNLTWFNLELNLEADPPVVPRELLARCERIFYNGIPECGTRMFKEVFALLAQQNDIPSINIDQEWWNLEEGDNRQQYVSDMKDAEGRFLLTSHFYFYEFTDIFDSASVVYINIVREPIDWFESAYNWNKYEAVDDPASLTRSINTSESVAECVRRSTGCAQDVYFASPLRFLAGTKEVRREPNDDTLTMAMKNVADHYPTVGLYEDLPAFMEVLEFLMPRVFSNITLVYQSLGYSLGVKEMELKSKTKTPRIEELDGETKEILEPQLMYDSVLYDYAKERFYKLFKAVRTLKQLQ